MPETILIIDHDPAQLRMTEYAVGQQLGYNVITTRDYQEARLQCFDLMLLDMSQPAPRIFQFIRDIKITRPQLPVIVLTRYGDDSYASHAIQSGASDFLTKPVSIERLRVSIVNALRIRQMSELIKQMRPLEAHYADGNAAASAPTLLDVDGQLKKLRAIEQEVICFALRHAGGCMTHAARSLGIGRSTLYRRLSELENSGYVSRANQTTRPMIAISSGERS